MTDNHEATKISRRLAQLREQLRRENRRSAAPFSHRLASDGPLWKLRDQIRDVSRLADALLLNFDETPAGLRETMFGDLRRLIETQSRWTERLENQIWRLESQVRLMRRLQQALSHGSPGTDQILELCEHIARESLVIPDGLLLLPEPGHRLILPSGGPAEFTARCVEVARLSVYSGMTLMPQHRGAELAVGALSRFSECWLSRHDHTAAAPSGQTTDTSSRLALDLTTAFHRHHLPDGIREFAGNMILTGDLLERKSLQAADSAVPPDIREFFADVTIPDAVPEDFVTPQFSFDQRWTIPCILTSLGVRSREVGPDLITSAFDGDASLVLTHKLRRHDGHETTVERHLPGLRRPHFRIHQADGVEAGRP